MKFLLIAQLLMTQFPTSPIQVDNERLISDPNIPWYVIADAMEMPNAQILIPGGFRPNPFEGPGRQILIPGSPFTPDPFEVPAFNHTSISDRNDRPTMPRRPINEKTAIRGNWLRRR